MSQLVLLTGPPNAGKSSTAVALCERYDRMAHVDVAVLRDMLRMGRLRPWDETPEGRKQRLLLIEAACGLARRFLEGGYGVVIEDVALPEDLAAYRTALQPLDEVAHAVVLLSPLATCLAREQEHPTEWHRAGHLERVYERFVSWRGIAAVQPEALPPEQVADRVMALAAEGRARLQKAK